MGGYYTRPPPRLGASHMCFTKLGRGVDASCSAGALGAAASASTAAAPTDAPARAGAPPLAPPRPPEQANAPREAAVGLATGSLPAPRSLADTALGAALAPLSPAHRRVVLLHA